MASILSTIIMFLHLVHVVFPSDSSACFEPSCDRTSCQQMEPSRHYNETGLLNGIAGSTTAHRVNNTAIVLHWDSSSLHPKLDWERYMVKWRFGFKGKFNCAILPKDKTTLVVADEPNKPPRNEIEVLLDILPLPNNYDKFWRKTVYIKEGSGSTTTKPATSPAKVNATPGPTSSGNNTISSSKPTTTKPTTPAKYRRTSPEGTNLTLAIGLVFTLLAVVVMVLCFCWSRCRKSALKGAGGESTNCTEKNDPCRTLIGSAQPSEYQKRSYVVSYWPENDKYIEKIASIVAWFRESAGYAMIMDKMATTEICSKGHVRWAESEIKKADKVLVFLSPGYINTYMKDDFDLKMSTDEEKRVWYEMQILKGIYSSTRSANKIVCVLTDDQGDTYDLPPWVVVKYRWPGDKDKILMRLNELPEIQVQVY